MGRVARRATGRGSDGGCFIGDVATIAYEA
jgi:hypothetical protein